MNLQMARNMYTYKSIKKIYFGVFMGGYVIQLDMGGSTDTVETSRGKQKMYKTFETVLNDYKYITGREINLIQPIHAGEDK